MGLQGHMFEVTLTTPDVTLSAALHCDLSQRSISSPERTKRVCIPSGLCGLDIWRFSELKEERLWGANLAPFIFIALRNDNKKIDQGSEAWKCTDRGPPAKVKWNTVWDVHLTCVSGMALHIAFRTSTFWPKIETKLSKIPLEIHSCWHYHVMAS